MTTTIAFTDVRVGDKVRVTFAQRPGNDYTDTRTFTVRRVAEDRIFYADRMSAFLSPGLCEKIELLERQAIRPGDKVRKVYFSGEVKHTIEFTVNYVHAETGFIEPRYGDSFRPDGFEVVERA